MATNLIIQYSIVGTILAGAVVWVIVKAVKAYRNRDSNNASCGCCSLKSSCNSINRKNKK